MKLIADILMIAGTCGAALYCYVLAARLKRFSTLETGMGGAIAVLSAQVDDMTQALEKASAAAKTSAKDLAGLTGRAEAVTAKLELLLASMHDLPEPSTGASADSDQSIKDRKLRFMRRRAVRDDLEAAE